MRAHVVLHPDLAEWTATPGGRLFCTLARERIANGGKLDRPMRMRLTARERADLVDLFGTNAVTGQGIHLGRADAVLRGSRHALPLRQLLIGADGPIRTKRGQARYRSIVKRQKVLRERAEALAAMAGVRELTSERSLLAALPDDSRRLAPAGTHTGTSHWATYYAAVRAAAEWYRGSSRGWKYGERELATQALGGSKQWTDASKAAFSKLIGRPFSDAVHTTDTGLRMTGPAEWHRQGLVADLSRAEPFIELPGRAAAQDGHLDLQATGVLLIENQETFEAVSSRTTVPTEWLCIWTGGFASDALALFLRSRVPPSLPIAAWGDLDPPGVGIILNLAEKSDRAIRPIGMDAVLYHNGSKLDEEPAELERWRAAAQTMTESVPAHFQGLLAAIVAHGGMRCEQEGLHEQVLPQLHRWLNELARRE
ncbi:MULTISPECIES: Wadjet anti-phage system protein JetD domain-containing protein [Streptomycetaceae]|uniref:Wadjet anti-phage system protein JetD domain-containing protein n=1 Tax=Streptomycetaceae TaxID=2062 RepID=UPI00093E999B|nr:Wadjet anti-phage system protein JetD domain-containing protein [Streptomyces sp. CB02056]